MIVMTTRAAALALTGLFLGCCLGSDPASASEAGSSRDGIEWRLEYQGELAGVVEGEVLAVTSVMTNIAIAGGAYGDSPGRRAPQKMRLSMQISAEGEARSAQLNLTLPDGTTCHNTEPLKTELENTGKKTFAASFAGAMDCDGKQAVFTGWVNADP